MLQELPICAITTINSATSVTQNYWNTIGYDYNAGVIGFGPGNTEFWNQVGTNWVQY
jgi:hypothetical protein